MRRPRRKEIRRGLRESVGLMGLMGLMGEVVASVCFSGGFTNGVVEGEGDGLNQGVVDGFIVGLLRDGLAASATHCKQDKRRYEGSR